MEVYSKNLKAFFYAMILFFTTACTAVMYEGEKREIHEVALITSLDIMIETIDGKKPPLFRAGNNVTYHVLPGQHQLDVTLNKQIGGVMTYTSNESIRVGFIAEAGRVYVVHPIINGGKWSPGVRDITNQ